MKNLGFDQIVPQILGNSQKGQDSFIQHAFDIFGTTNMYILKRIQKYIKNIEEEITLFTSQIGVHGKLFK